MGTHVWEEWLAVICLSHRHPDKNRSPEAAQRFMEITEAYEVLSDEAARRRYDNRGSSYFGFDDPFNIVITPFSRRRTFKSRVDVINSDVFFNTVLPASHSKPYLLYFYSDFDCFLCLNMDTVWDRMKKVGRGRAVGVRKSEKCGRGRGVWE